MMLLTGRPFKSSVQTILCLLLIFCGDCNGQTTRQDRLYPFPKGGKYGFLDRSGRIVIKPRFDHVRLFSEGLAAVTIENKVGFIDAIGQQVIPTIYEDALSFSEGLAAVQTGQKWGYIDKSGRQVIEARFGHKLGGVGSFSQGLAPVWFNGKMGYIDHSGGFVIEPQFGFAEEFSEGLAAIGMSGNQQDSRPKFGYIDKTGKVVVPITYAGARPFHGGLAIVTIFRNGVSFYPQAVINRDGVQVIGPLEAGIGDFHEGLAFLGVKEGNTFMDKTGKQIMRPEFKSFDDSGTSDFYEGLAAVSNPRGQSGYVDRTGRMVIPARFGIACKFTGGLALVSEHDREGYIDKTGKYIRSWSTDQMPYGEDGGCFW